MTNQERFQKYIDEHCKDCKHKNEDLCDIRISYFDGVVTTRCIYYERDKNEEKKTKKKDI